MPEHPDVKQFELGMVAVLVGASSIQETEIVRHLLVKGLDQQTNDGYQKLGKFFAAERFWELLLPSFGLARVDEQAPLPHFFRALVYNHFVTETAFQPQDDSTLGPKLTALADAYQFRLPHICRLFIEDWFRARPARRVGDVHPRGRNGVKRTQPA